MSKNFALGKCLRCLILYKKVLQNINSFNFTCRRALLNCGNWFYVPCFICLSLINVIIYFFFCIGNVIYTLQILLLSVKFDLIIGIATVVWPSRVACWIGKVKMTAKTLIRWLKVGQREDHQHLTLRWWIGGNHCLP